MTLTLEEIKERLIKEYDPDDITEALELSTEDLLDAFEEKLLENMDKFGEELDDIS